MNLRTEKDNLKENQKLAVVSWQQQIVLFFWVTNVPDLFFSLTLQMPLKKKKKNHLGENSLKSFSFVCGGEKLLIAGDNKVQVPGIDSELWCFGFFKPTERAGLRSLAHGCVQREAVWWR